MYSFHGYASKANKAIIHYITRSILFNSEIMLHRFRQGAHLSSIYRGFGKGEQLNEIR